MSPDLLMGLEDQYWDDNEQNGHEDAQNQGPDVQALGGGGIGLGPSQVANHLPVPRLHGVGERYEAQAAGVHEEGVEQGPDDMVGHGGLALDVDHGGPWEDGAMGCPQHRHLVLLLVHFLTLEKEVLSEGSRSVAFSVEGSGAVVSGCSEPCFPLLFQFLRSVYFS